MPFCSMTVKTEHNCSIFLPFHLENSHSHCILHLKIKHLNMDRWSRPDGPFETYDVKVKHTLANGLRNYENSVCFSSPFMYARTFF